MSTAPSLPAQRILAGQKALVTGANSGIGRGVAIALGQAGADVIVNYVAGEDAANAVVDEIRQSGADAHAIKADVSSESEVAAMFTEMFEAFRNHRHPGQQCGPAARLRIPGDDAWRNGARC